MKNRILGIVTLFCLITVLVPSSCSTKKIVNKGEAIANLQQVMTGSYDSSAQAEIDSSYYNISLHMYPIWENRSDYKYLYVEQALASMQYKPYRQRVYKLEYLDNGNIASHVYTLKKDSIFIGKWKDPKFFGQFGLSILDIREGCEVVLKSNGVGYMGSTVEDNCKSTLRGASYATSKVNIESNRVTSWDQGFDAEGKQVWGATKGPYIFEKLKEN